MQNSGKSKLLFALVAFALLSAVPSIVAASSASAVLSPIGTADQKPAQFSMPALLDTALDSKKRNAGDEVQAKIVGDVKLADGTVIPKGAKVIGHVAESKAISKGDGKSLLTIAFDKIAMPDGKALSIKGHIQAVAPNPYAGQNSGGGVDYGSSLNRTIQHAGPSQEEHLQIPVLNEQSAGVEGIKNLGLSDDGVLTSGEKSVKLERNAQLVLRAQILPAQ